MKTLALFSPSIVLLVWAGFVALGCVGVLVTVVVFVALGIAIRYHVHAEKERHHHAI